MRGNGSPAGDLAKGALAGAAATWVMNRVTTALYEREDPAARRREDDVREGKTAYGVAAEKVAGVVGASLSGKDRETAGQAIHWALGIGAGSAYALLRRRVPAADRAQGLGFGTAFWAVVDETLVPVLGLTPGPTAFPWETHARGLAGHLTFGLVADTVLDLLDRVA